MKTPIAKSQYDLTAYDLQTLLALVRGATLAEAARRLEADASTVFRSVQRIEKSLGQRLFERSRQGYLPTEPMLALVHHDNSMMNDKYDRHFTTFLPLQIGHLRDTLKILSP